MTRTSRLFLSLSLALTVSGCYGVTSAGRQLHSDVDASKDRIAKLEAAQNAQIEKLKQAEAKAQKSIDQLNDVIERASIVQRNSADVTVQVTELQSKVATLEGKLAELQYAIDELKKTPSAAAPPPATTTPVAQPTTSAAPKGDDVPADKDEHFKAAYRAYQQRDFAKARTLFKSFIARYGTDDQADNAQYWMGASYLVEDRPATALAELKKVIQNFRTGDAVDEALLDMAEAFYRLRACSDSRNALDTLIRTQPNSPYVSKAKQKLKEMKKLEKDYCTS